MCVGPELEDLVVAADDQTLPYVCIEGVTEAIGTPLPSMYKPECEQGVIQKVSLVEHRSRRTQGYWSVFGQVAEVEAWQCAIRKYSRHIGSMIMSNYRSSIVANHH